MARALIIGGEASMEDGLRDYFQYEGHSLELAAGRWQALEEQQLRRYGLVLVDADASEVDVAELCRWVRGESERLPVIVLSSKSRDIDKASALLAGADDYVVRPFGYLELLARVKAILRRAGDGDGDPRTYRFGSVTVDFDRSLVTKRGSVVELSSRELDLLRYFVEHEGQIVTRRQLLEAVWGETGSTLTRPIDMQIVKLRRKLEEKGKPRHILTVHRFGYRFVGGTRFGAVAR